MERVYLSLGSNLEPQRHLAAAVQALRLRFGDVIVSTAYRFPAIGFIGPDFVNLAAAIDSDLEPEALNDWLHALEDAHGRRRDVPRYADRTLDIDIVLFGDRVMQGRGNLKLPRDELSHAFVLKPLSEIAPRLRHPLGHDSLADLWQQHRDYATPFAQVALDGAARA